MESAMARIDVDRLRAYLLDYVGTAAFSGFPAAIIDVMDISDMDPCELCRKAEGLGIDLSEFAADEAADR